MNHPNLIQRRKILKALSAAPLLPLGGMSLFTSSSSAQVATLVAPGASTMGVFVSAVFKGMAAPNLDNPAEMAINHVASKLMVKYSTGQSTSYSLGYESFFITGDELPDGRGGKIVAGGNYDINNKPLIDNSVEGKSRQMFSDCPDGTSLLAVPNPKVRGVKGKTVFAVAQFEYISRDLAGEDNYGKVPSPIAVLTLDQNPKTGKLSLVKYHNVDTSKVHGLWITCGSSLSPWGTHLSSEEYEPDAFATDNKQLKAFSKNLYGDETTANPYHYGHIPEVTVHPDGTGSIKKHYCMGRISHELVEMMPDERTALMGDDATNGGLFMFVADRTRDLSSGNLYVAKVGAGFSVDPSATPAPLTWIHLGHASSAEVERMANTLKPTDIMDVKTTDPVDKSYTLIYFNGKANWIKLKAGMEKAAAFLETHRYAALLGASMGYSKMEGTTVNIKDKVAYSALAYIKDSMVKGGKGWTDGNGIALDKALNAGGIMALKLRGGQQDQSGKFIDSDWVPADSRALIVGEDLAIPDGLGNTAHADKIGNPDNLKFSEKMRTLFIGEDSGMHVNNFVWAYNVDTKELSRIMSIPAGAEATGLFVADDINGWTYILSNFQHAGDWEKHHSKVQATLDPIIRANYKDRFGSAVGYLTAHETSIKL